jgi:release factor glutamine methyltransferase
VTSLWDRMVAARRRLERAGVSPADATLDAEMLARHVLGWDRARFIARRGEAPPPGFDLLYDRLVLRRSRREPVAYLVGHREFFGREFMVSPAVLVPRPETELLVEAALERIAEIEAPRIVDVGTGSGCIAITLALEMGTVPVKPLNRDCPPIRATDTSAAALDVAQRNARRLGADSQIAFVLGSLLDPDSADPFDLVVSNPPYIATVDRDALPPEVRLFEPAEALFGGADGLAVVRPLVSAAERALRPGGWLAIEIGAGQVDAVSALVETPAWRRFELRQDLQGIPRVALAERS